MGPKLFQPASLVQFCIDSFYVCQCVSQVTRLVGDALLFCNRWIHEAAERPRLCLGLGLGRGVDGRVLGGVGRFVDPYEDFGEGVLGGAAARRIGIFL